MYSTSETIHKSPSRLRKMAALYYSIAFIILFASCKVSADSTEQKDACEAVFNGTIEEKNCCEGSMFLDDDDSSKCNDDGDMSCDYFKCLAKESDLLVDDKVNDEKVKEMLKIWEKENPKDKATIERVRRNCSGGNFAELLSDTISSDDVCEPLQLFLCIYINVLFECKSWKQDAQCSKMKEYTQTCKNYLEV